MSDSLNDVLAELRSISARLAGIEAWQANQKENITRFWATSWPAMEEHAKEQGKICASIDKRLALVESEMHRISHLDTRLSHVEAKQNWILGIVASVAAIGGWLARMLHLGDKP